MDITRGVDGRWWAEGGGEERTLRDVRMAVIAWDTAMIVYPARSLNCN